MVLEYSCKLEMVKFKPYSHFTTFDVQSQLTWNCIIILYLGMYIVCLFVFLQLDFPK